MAIMFFVMVSVTLKDLEIPNCLAVAIHQVCIRAYMYARAGNLGQLLIRRPGLSLRCLRRCSSTNLMR
jgi:hypothetical protein